MHLKRHTAPREWPIHIKEKKFVFHPIPGPHPLRKSIPLIIVIKDILKHAETASEAKKIIHDGKILVDGKIVKEHRFPIGLMDVIEIPETKEIYRFLPILGKGLRPIEIPYEEKDFKLCKIINKFHVKGGDLQFTLHDGRNIRFDTESEINPRKFMVGDTFKISLPDQKFIDHLAFNKDYYGLIIEGSKGGCHGKIIEFTEGTFFRKPTATIILQNGEKVTTLKDYIFVIGDDKPWIKLH